MKPQASSTLLLTRCHLRTLVMAATVGLWIPACGGGIPITVRIDEYTTTLSIDEAVANMEKAAANSGGAMAGIASIPEEWPSSLPNIKLPPQKITTPAMPIDLTPEDATGAAKYKQINKYTSITRRIELNRLILRVEENTASIAIPPLQVELASEKDAASDDPEAWQVIAHLPSCPPGTVGDLELEFVPGGETLFHTELADDTKELALRATGWIEYDTAINPLRPHGVAKLRLISIVTFFMDPERM